ncbi:MAG: peptidoglycan editing factor PgeF [Candidatus Aquicultor sp.]|nr:peptidoglycan editing factor PgeF [Candidatus Aquicultor sp.]
MGYLRGDKNDDYSDYGLTLETADETSLYTSKALRAERGILVAFTTREGGYSRTPYDSLNLALHVGDDHAVVIQNREALCVLLGLDASRMTCAEQVHENKVAVVNESIAGSGAVSLGGAVRGADALVTNLEAVPLALFFADCVPVVIVEPRHRIIGMAHAGWRGVHADIVENTINRMVEDRAVEPADMIAFIGPSIGGCCYRVGEDLIKKFAEKFSDKEHRLHGGKLDLPALVYYQLEKAGIERARIFSCEDSCTSCRNELFFSYRGDGGVTGRQAAIAAVLPLKDFDPTSDLR